MANPPSDPSTVQLKGHMPALDGIRGLAILMVFATHFLRIDQPANFFERILHKIASYGHYGVELFFVLSGFLITGILIDTRKTSGYFRNFYMRRLVRIFPLYYGVLLVALVILPLFIPLPGFEKTMQNQAWLWMYVANIFVGIKGSYDSLPMFSHFWSLAVEEHFYLIWPVLVYKINRLETVALCLVVGGLLVRIGMVAVGANDVALTTFTPARMDGLALGAVLAIIAREENGVARLTKLAPRAVLVAAGVLAISFLVTFFAPLSHLYIIQVRHSMYSLCFGALLISSLTGPRIIQSIFKSSIMRFFGKYSYGLYVYHMFYGTVLLHSDFVKTVTPWVGSRVIAIYIQAAIAIGVAVLISLLSFNLFEKHFLKLKRHF